MAKVTHLITACDRRWSREFLNFLGHTDFSYCGFRVQEWTLQGASYPGNIFCSPWLQLSVRLLPLSNNASDNTIELEKNFTLFIKIASNFQLRSLKLTHAHNVLLLKKTYIMFSLALVAVATLFSAQRTWAIWERFLPKHPTHCTANAYCDNKFSRR